MTAISAVETPVSEKAAALSARHRRIVLTGFMGAGKSTVGALLAERLGWRFIDLDLHIEQRSGSTIPDLFALHGEEDFRRLESTALASALASPQTVVALGGGAPESLTNRLLLEQTPGTTVIHLDAPFALLASRCAAQAQQPGATLRPNFADPYAAHARFEQRQPIYRRLAHVSIGTADDTPSGIVGQILLALA